MPPTLLAIPADAIGDGDDEEETPVDTVTDGAPAELEAGGLLTVVRMGLGVPMARRESVKLSISEKVGLGSGDGMGDWPRARLLLAGRELAALPGRARAVGDGDDSGREPSSLARSPVEGARPRGLRAADEEVCSGDPDELISVDSLGGVEEGSPPAVGAWTNFCLGLKVAWHEAQAMHRLSCLSRQGLEFETRTRVGGT